MKRSIFILVLIFLYVVNYTIGSTNIKSDSIPYSAYLLSEYIKYPSVTGNEKPAGEFLASIAENHGLYVEVFTDEYDSYNFTASIYPLSLGKPNVILLNHIDVVHEEPMPDSKFPPYSGIIAQGYVWGRGAIDNKGPAVMQLLAMVRMLDYAVKYDLPYNITLLSVSGEETGGSTGAKIVTDRFLDKLNAVVVYGEGGIGLPGVLNNKPDKKVFGISVASKRTLWLKLTLDMEGSGHGSVPPISYTLQEKVKALNKLVNRNQRRIIRFTNPAIEMFYEIGQLEGGIRGMFLKNIKLFRPFVVPQMKKDDIIYSIISNTITVTGFYTQPGPPNNIPQRTTAILDCRLLPGIKTDFFVEKVTKWLANDNIQISIIEEGIFADYTSEEYYYNKLKRAIENIYPDAGVIKILVPASNDNNYFRAKGIPTYGVLPVFMTIEEISTIHNINERMPVQLLEIGIDAYAELIRIYWEDALEN